MPLDYLAVRLPTINYKGRGYYVDFRLEELRDAKTAKSVKFTKLKGGKNSPLKQELRGIRSATYSMYYMKGLDD